MSVSISEWNDFFVAEAGGTALARLLFVAVSINLPRVLADEHLPRRASESLTLVLAVRAIATLGLLPGNQKAKRPRQELSPRLSLRRAKTARPEPTPANSVDRGSRKW
jgi:hypothetical protein